MARKRLFQDEPEPTIFAPRAATVDAAANRQNLITKRRLVETPGLIDETPSQPGDSAIYAQGLQEFLAGNTQGAVDAWIQIPHHMEAKRGLQRIYQQIQSAQ